MAARSGAVSIPLRVSARFRLVSPDVDDPEKAINVSIPLRVSARFRRYGLGRQARVALLNVSIPLRVSARFRPTAGGLKMSAGTFVVSQSPSGSQLDSDVKMILTSALMALMSQSPSGSQLDSDQPASLLSDYTASLSQSPSGSQLDSDEVILVFTYSQQVVSILLRVSARFRLGRRRHLRRDAGVYVSIPLRVSARFRRTKEKRSMQQEANVSILLRVSA